MAPDNKKLKGHADDIRIDRNDPGELRYRSQTWGVDKREILDAMDATGSVMANVIYEYLTSTGSIGGSDEEE